MQGPSTLLSPEGTGAFAPLGQDRRSAERPRTDDDASLLDMLQRDGVRFGARGDSGRRDRPYLENCTVDASIIICSCQVIKGTRWMPWHQEPKKDVGACDKPRGVGNQTSIRGFPNRET